MINDREEYPERLNVESTSAADSHDGASLNHTGSLRLKDTRVMKGEELPNLTNLLIRSQ